MSKPKRQKTSSTIATFAPYDRGILIHADISRTINSNLDADQLRWLKLGLEDYRKNIQRRNKLLSKQNLADAVWELYCNDEACCAYPSTIECMNLMALIQKNGIKKDDAQNKAMYMKRFTFSILKYLTLKQKVYCMRPGPNNSIVKFTLCLKSNQDVDGHARQVFSLFDEEKNSETVYDFHLRNDSGLWICESSPWLQIDWAKYLTEMLLPIDKFTIRYLNLTTSECFVEWNKKQTQRKDLFRIEPMNNSTDFIIHKGYSYKFSTTTEVYSKDVLNCPRVLERHFGNLVLFKTTCLPTVIVKSIISFL